MREVVDTNVFLFSRFFLFVGYTKRLELGILQNLQFYCKFILLASVLIRISRCCWFPSHLKIFYCRSFLPVLN
jgi:hypothetical protein